jgi:hypothetical protein
MNSKQNTHSKPKMTLVTAILIFITKEKCKEGKVVPVLN